MSSNKEYPNDGLSYSDIRLAYYIYTWDNTNKLKQKTAWSTIGTYSINSNADIIYTSNKNQLLKTNGSNGVSIVKDTYGVIVNNNADVAPTILKINGTYIVGLDNIDGTVSPHTLHTTIPTIDSHLLANTNGIDGNNYEITYTDMWASNIAILDKDDFTINNYFYPFTSYDKGTVIEPVELAVIGKETNGINGITNKGFIYNNYTYKRNVNLINYYNELYNYFKDWQFGSKKLSIDFSKLDGYNIGKANTSAVTILTDFDVMVVSNFASMFKNTYDENINIKSTDSNFNALLSTYSSLSSIANQIKVLLKNNDNDPSSSLLQTPLTYNLLKSSVTALACWSYAKDIESLWGSKTTAIVMEKLTANSELFDFSSKPNATSIIGMNNRTSQWVELQLPIYDQTYELVMKDVINNEIGTYSLASLSDFINQYTITFNNNLTENNLSTSTSISIIYSTGANIYSDDFNLIKVFTYNDNTFEWTSYSYFLQNNNFNNSASTFRFIGIDSSGEKPFKNNQGRNTIKLTGFNKILLNDLYENPNTYQNADTSYYYYIGDDIQHGSSTSDINKIIGRVSSYTVSLTSAIKIDQNVLIGGCGSDGKEHTRGSPGFFYIPLPSDIDMNDNSAYVDTHWMLTTWTPNISKNAAGRGIINNKDVLYKYTKMNDIITTGLYGGFTPYYNPNNNTTAGIIRIPQISYGVTDYGSPKYVTEDENKIAKLSKIMFTNNGDVVTFPNNGQIKFYNYKEGDSKSYIFIGDKTGAGGDDITVTPIGNIPPNINITDTSFKTYFSDYKQFAACVFTLNSNEKNIILQNNLMNNNNVAYLDLIGYPDEEFDNLSFDVERKYIFTFNAHIQVTNLNLMSDQINYGTPSLLLVGHFRNRYCKANIKVGDSNMIYPGRDIFIPLLNKPLENPVNNIYNVEGTYILSWNTTGDSNNEFNDISKYAMYIPKNAKTYTTTGSTFEQIYSNFFNETLSTTTNLDAGNVLHFENVLDRIYAFILTGETVNNNFMYQFVNNTTYQDNSNKILSNDDIDLITGRINGSPIFNTTTTEYNTTSSNFDIIINNSNGSEIGKITCILVDDVEDGTNYVFNTNKITLSSDYTDVASLTATTNDSTSNSVSIKLEKKEENATPLNGINITINLIKTDKNDPTNIKVECYDNHLSFDFNTGVDSGILGINEPMLSMTIQRY